MRYRDDLEDSSFEDTPLTAMGGLEHSNTATKAFSNASLGNASAMADIAGASVSAATDRQIARMRAEEYARRNKKSGVGGVFNLLGTAASFIPGAGPLIGKGLGAIGGFLD